MDYTSSEYNEVSGHMGFGLAGLTLDAMLSRSRPEVPGRLKYPLLLRHLVDRVLDIRREVDHP